jgi:DNA-binding NarL/FixJ family response regulator
MVNVETEHRIGEADALPNPLIVVERREFIRGCLACWLAKYCADLAAVPVADVETASLSDVLPDSVAAIIGMEPSERHDWVHRQISSLRGRHPRLPIILIVEAEQTKMVAEQCVELDLQGFIPMYTSLEVAAAAVHLVVAGGSYFPRPRSTDVRKRELSLGHEQPTADVARIAELTSRERAVLNLLSSGVPNKVIAHRLGMSLSTVKAHVHHIIRKLKVGNRTEVALLTQHMQEGTWESPDAHVPPVQVSTSEAGSGNDARSSMPAVDRGSGQ